MAKPTITGKLGFFFDGGVGDKWMHDGVEWLEWVSPSGGEYLPLTGGWLTGNLNINGDAGAIPLGVYTLSNSTGADVVGGSFRTGFYGGDIELKRFSIAGDDVGYTFKAMDGSVSINTTPKVGMNLTMKGGAMIQGDITLGQLTGDIETQNYAYYKRTAITLGDPTRSTEYDKKGISIVHSAINNIIMDWGDDGNIGIGGLSTGTSKLTVNGKSEFTDNILVSAQAVNIGGASHTSYRNSYIKYVASDDTEKIILHHSPDGHIGLGTFSESIFLAVGGGARFQGTVEAAAATEGKHAVSKAYVDNKFVSTSGDTMTGPLHIPWTSGDTGVIFADSSGNSSTHILNSYLKVVDSAAVSKTLMHWSSNGNIGIGGFSESALFTVHGDVKLYGTVSASMPTSDAHLATKEYVDSLVMSEEKPYEGLATVEVDIAGLFPSKASCIAAASLLEIHNWSKDHTFIIKDTFGTIKPTYLVQYVSNGSTGPGSSTYKFFVTILVEAK